MAFSLAFFWNATERASLKPFWHDEIYTIVIASLPTLGTIWDAHLAGLDSMPPLNSMFTHAVFGIVGAGPITTRLPAMLGVWTWTVVSFAIVRRRSNTTAGLSAALLILLSGAGPLAYEARGYGVMLGLCALALFCWSEVASGRRRMLHLPLLACALAAAIWTHFYAALIVVPIITGELVRFVRTRKLDVAVLASLTAAAVAILPLYPLLKLAASQSATYFQKISVSQIPAAYVSISLALIGPWARAFGVLLAAMVLLPAFRFEPRRELRRIPVHEVAAALMTMFIPVWAILISLLVSGAFVPRYASVAAVGVFIVVPILASRLRNQLAPLLLCLMSCAIFVHAFRGTAAEVPYQRPLDYRPILRTALTESAPVVVTGTLYLQMWYYAPPEGRDRLTYLTNPSAALRLIGTDSLERDYLVLRDWSTVIVQDYEAFIRANERFYLYDVGALSWILEKLREDRAGIREIGRESGATMYEITPQFDAWNQP